MKHRLILTILMLFIATVTFSQIRTDYRDGLDIPSKIDLTAVAPKGIIKFTLEKPFANGFFTLIAQHDNYREETNYIRLMNREVKRFLSIVWGKSTITKKKVKVKEFLLSLGCEQNEYGYMLCYGRRWDDAKLNDIDDEHYIYPTGFDRILTDADINDKYFGRPLGFEHIFTDLLPQSYGVTHLELSYNFLNGGEFGIIIQTTKNYVNQYYYRLISREEAKDIEYTIAGNYPRKIKEDYICAKMVAYGINTMGQFSSKWGLYQIKKQDGTLDYHSTTKVISQSSTSNRTSTPNMSLRSIFFEFLRSKVFTKEEREWYNQHFTREQLDAMAGFGVGIATGGGGNGQYGCRSCSATFSNAADLRAHENAYHDY